MIWLALILGGGQSFAASSEDRAYAAALQAFHDQFYSSAKARLTEFLDTYHKSTNAPNAVLLLAQSEFYLQNYSAVTNQLTDPASLDRAKAVGLADQYVYWLAEAQFAQGDVERAAQTFVSLTENFPDSRLALNAAVAAAAAFGQITNWSQVDILLDSTDRLFQRKAQLDATNEEVASGRLLQAESKCTQRDFAKAISILNLLNPAALTPEQGWKRAYLLFRANQGINNLDAALAATTNMLQIARSGHGDVWVTNLAESVASHARVLEQQGRLDDAAAALQENLSSTTPTEQQQQAVLKLAEIAVAQKKLADAEAVLEKFLAQFPDSPAVGAALLALGELHLKNYIVQPSATNDHLGAASAKLDQFLTTYTNSPLAGKAYLARGWYYWLADKYLESLADFQMAAQVLPMSEDLAVARFKMGDAQFALKDFSGAQTNYQAVLTDFSTLPEVGNSLGSRALYQILRSRLALHDALGMNDAMEQLLGRFFTNAPTESGLLLAGEGFSDFDSPVKAREVLQKFESEYTNSLLMPRVAFAVGRTYEREQNWHAAVTNYQAWLRTYPTNELRSQVEYAHAWAVAQTGDEAEAFQLFSQYPTNALLTPLAYWWVADHNFRLGGTNFSAAEYNYELIFQDFSTNQLAYPAQFMAGRAAMGRFGYPEAIHYFGNLINSTNCPDEWKDRARFAYCDALLLMPFSDTNNINLTQATTILSQMYSKAATNIVGVQAWCKTGDIDLLMGAFDVATNAYAQVLNSPAATQELRNQAQVGLGMVLEKKAEGLPTEEQRPLLLQALHNYLDVLYTTNTVADALWIKKAGLQALPLMMGLKEGDVNKFFDSLERWLPALKDTLEKKRVALNN